MTGARATQEPLPIKVAVDGTPTNDPAIRFAALRARVFDRPLALVHVIPAWDTPRTHAPHEFERVGHVALRRAEEIAGALFPADRITAELRTGPVISTLVEASADAHELIIGSDSPLTRFTGGGVVVGVASTTTHPLIVVPTAWEEPPRSHGLVVAALDTVDEPSLQAAFQVARDEHARLQIVQVHRLPQHYARIFTSLAEFPAWQWNAEQRIQEAVNSVSAHYPGVRYGITVDWGSPADILRSRSANASLLLLHHDPDSWRQIGRTGRTLMQSSHCPVRVVNTAKAAVEDRKAMSYAVLAPQPS